MSQQKNIAVIGSGYWGKNLVRTFSNLGVLATICDSNIETLNKLKATCPDVNLATDYQQVLKDTAIKGVVISTPAITHFQFVKQALQHGKDVFVEKPLSLNVYEGEGLVKLAKDENRILMVGHILQYHNAIMKLKAIIDAGELGQIQYIYSNRLNIGKIRTEENILWSFAPHDISVILMLLNEFPKSIYATGGNYLQQNIADVTMSTLTFNSGVKAHIFVSWLHPFKEQKLIVVGDKKMAVFDDVSQEKLFLYSHKVEWKDRIPIVSKADAQAVPLTLEEPLKNECLHFIDCIAHHKKPMTDGIEGLQVLSVLNMLQDSLNTGKVVEVSVLKQKSHDEYFVHESSYIDDDVQIGKGTKIWHFCHVLSHSKIGKNCKIGQNVVIGPDAIVGDNCKIQNNVSIYKGVTLEEGVFCGPSMVFTNVFNPRSEVPRMDELRTTLVKKGATIGANATILCGITIGRYAFIGAGAVVTHDVPDFALVYGSPAKIKNWICSCGIKLNFQTANETKCCCGQQYTFSQGQVLENPPNFLKV